MELHLLLGGQADYDGQSTSTRENQCEDLYRQLLFGAFSMLALAESYSGKLLDASCYDQQKKATACDATSATTSFAIDNSGTVLKLDTAGNTKASAALKNRADRVDPSKPQAKEVMAKVDGTEKGGTINVTSIDVQ